MNERVITLSTAAAPISVAILATLLLVHVVSGWVVTPLAASVQDPQLNQIEQALRNIENRLARIESAALASSGFDSSSPQLARLESQLVSLGGLDSSLARIESRILSLSAGDSHLSRIDSRLASLAADVRIVVEQVCADTGDC
jgi:hypothetical protein